LDIKFYGKLKQIEKWRMGETVKGREIYKILGTKNHLFSLRATPALLQKCGGVEKYLYNAKSRDKNVSKFLMVVLTCEAYLL